MKMNFRKRMIRSSQQSAVHRQTSHGVAAQYTFQFQLIQINFE